MASDLGVLEMVNPVWDDEKSNRLEELWGNRLLSAREMARELGVTRNAVLGKAHRLGLPERDKRPGRKRHGHIGKLTRIILGDPKPKWKPPEKPKEEATGPFIPAKPVQLMDLTHKTCRWPLDGDPVRWYCGDKPESGFVYCKFHCKIAYSGKPEPKPSTVKAQWG